jgi:hypothetical protein
LPLGGNRLCLWSLPLFIWHWFFAPIKIGKDKPSCHGEGKARQNSWSWRLAWLELRCDLAGEFVTFDHVVEVFFRLAGHARTNITHLCVGHNRIDLPVQMIIFKGIYGDRDKGDNTGDELLI